MNKAFLKKLFIPLLGILFISSCGGNTKNNDFDLSNFKVPIKKSPTKIDISKEDKVEKKEVEFKLILSDKKKDIIDLVKFGKKDPFSSLESESNQFITSLKINGFISLDNKDYALVEFLNEKGMINVNSIGGLNTKLLPNKAIVKKINPLKEELTFSLDEKLYTIKLTID